MSSKLQAKLKLLGEKVGYYAKVPGEDGTLNAAETTVVLGWLREADYKTTDHKAGLTIQEFKSYNFPFGSKGEYRTVASGEGDTLTAALVHAVLVLPLDDE